jgi:hypothetical protein
MWKHSAPFSALASVPGGESGMADRDFDDTWLWTTMKDFSDSTGVSFTKSVQLAK